MIIRRKLDVMQFLERFQEVASYDYQKCKYYFVFADKYRGGQYTLMKKDEHWSTHGKGADYCDIDETFIDDMDELVDFLWKHRAKVNQSLRELQSNTMSV